MGTTTIIAIAVAIVVLLAVAAAAWTYLNRQRSKKLRENFGPEYQRVVRAEGSERQAEQILEDRQKRLNEFDLKPLTPEEQERFAQRWQEERRDSWIHRE